MKKMVLVLALATIAMVTVASAQVGTYQDNIGIYLDEAGTINCGVLGVGAHPAHIVLTKLTAPTVNGWEVKIIPSNLFLGPLAYRGQAIDAGTREGEHSVGLADPLPAVNRTVVVADLDILITDTTNPGYIFMDGLYFPSSASGLPVYTPEGVTIVDLHYSTGDSTDPVFIANGDCIPVAEEVSSFGAVKSLYR